MPGFRYATMPPGVFAFGGTLSRSLRGSGTSRMRNAGALSPLIFEDVDELLSNLRYMSKQWRQAENLLIRMMAAAHKGLAEQKSRGMVVQDYRQGRPWGIPVRRISEDYYRGWKIRKVAPGMWMTYNDAREAYFIEFGINPKATMTVRRPILRMSAIATLRFLQRTRMLERFTGATIGARRNQRGQYRSFMARMMGSALIGVTGPTGHLPE